MATQAVYTAGANAALKVIRGEIAAEVPAWAQGMIPSDLAPTLAGAVAKAVVDAVDNYRENEAKGQA